MQKLAHEFYNQNTEEVAKALLGHHLVCRDSLGVERIGKIVEVEAYVGEEDLASHSSRGHTERTAPMFGPPGFSYVYLIYGLHHCFNVVTEPEGKGCAVLIRALEPRTNITERTEGPGLLCRAMKIDRTLNREDLSGDRVFITPDFREIPKKIVATPRVGVPYAREWTHRLLRFYIDDNTYVSRR